MPPNRVFRRMALVVDDEDDGFNRQVQKRMEAKEKVNSQSLRYRRLKADENYLKMDSI